MRMTSVARRFPVTAFAVPPVVYVARGGDGGVLYVGSAGNVRRRMGAHRRTSRWWHLHAELEILEFPTLARARATENDLICRYDPPFNISGGHGLGTSCLGRRCRVRRDQVARAATSRELRLARQARRQGAPPLGEWDAVRTMAVASSTETERATPHVRRPIRLLPQPVEPAQLPFPEWDELMADAETKATVHENPLPVPGGDDKGCSEVAIELARRPSDGCRRYSRAAVDRWLGAVLRLRVRGSQRCPGSGLEYSR